MWEIKKVFGELPAMADESSLQPQTLLDRRTVKHRNRAATQILVLWKGSSPAGATYVRVLGRSHAQISRILPRGQGRGLRGETVASVFLE